VFLCASEHEGFCVPLVEAFYKGVPVVAYAATAVPATMDGAGVLYEDREPHHVAALVSAIVEDASLAERIVQRQDAALQRLLAHDFKSTLLGFVEQALDAPLPRHPDVAFDFWDQVRQAETLAELRQYRPALYEALPPPPGRVEHQ